MTLRLVLGVLLVLVGAALIAVAVLGGRARLPRNRFAGVRTRSSLHSGPAFVAANKVAAPLLGAAGAVGVVGGAVVATGPPVVLAWVVTGVSVPAVLLLSALGGALGDRAAAALVAESPGPQTCGGACTGCDLVAGCRPDAATGADAAHAGRETGTA